MMLSHWSSYDLAALIYEMLVILNSIPPSISPFTQRTAVLLRATRT